MPHPTGEGGGGRNPAAMKILLGGKGPRTIRNWRVLHPGFALFSVTAPTVVHYISPR